MNLRELILSQTQTSTDIEIEDNNHVYTDQSDNYEDHQEIDNTINNTKIKKRSHFTKLLGIPSSKVLKKSSIFHSSPSVKYLDPKEELCNLPELKSYHKFPLYKEGPYSDHQLSIVRHIWYQCYHSKDFEGAAMALSVLCQCSEITLLDMKYCAEMCRYGTISDIDIDNRQQNQYEHVDNNHNNDGQNLSVMHMLLKGFLPPYLKDMKKKHNGIILTVELCIAQNDIESARRILNGNMNCLSFSNNQYLMYIETIVIITQIIELCIHIKESFTKCYGILFQNNTSSSKDTMEDISLIPSIQDIMKDPLCFTRCIQVIYMISTSLPTPNTIDRKFNSIKQYLIKISSYKMKCQELLKDLKISFYQSINRIEAGSVDCLDMVALYVAYLHSAISKRKAYGYLIKLEHVLIESNKKNSNVESDNLSNQHEKSFVLCNYYKLVSQYLVKYHTITTTTTNTSNDDNNNNNTCNDNIYTNKLEFQKFFIYSMIQTLEYEDHNYSTATNALLYRILVLNHMNAIGNKYCVEKLCTLIDKLPITSMKYYTSQHYSIWKPLANRLGRLSQEVDIDQPIAFNSELVRCLSPEHYKLFTLPNTKILEPTPDMGYQGNSPLVTDEMMYSAIEWMNQKYNTQQSITAINKEHMNSNTNNNNTNNDSSKSKNTINTNNTNTANTTATTRTVTPEQVKNIPEECAQECSNMQSRNWWTSTILSHSLLDDLNPTVMEFEADHFITNNSILINHYHTNNIDNVINNDASYLHTDLYFNSSLYKDSNLITEEVLPEKDTYAYWKNSEMCFNRIIAKIFTTENNDTAMLHSVDEIDDDDLDDSESFPINCEVDGINLDNTIPISSEIIKDVISFHITNHTEQLIPNRYIQSQTTSNNNNNNNNNNNKSSKNSLFNVCKVRMPLFHSNYYLTSETYKFKADQSIFKNTMNVYILSRHLLELLTYQALVRCHIDSQDNIFTIRIIQILLYHVIHYEEIYKIMYDNNKTNSIIIQQSLSSTTTIDIVAKNCLLYLIKSNINIKRAIRLGSYLASKSIGMKSSLTTMQHYQIHPILTSLEGQSNTHYYQPI